MKQRESGFFFYKLARCFLWIVLKSWNRLRSVGTEHIPDEGPCILASNHVSFLDPPVLGSGCMKRPIRFVARNTLYKAGIFGRLMHAFHTIPLDRTKGDVSAMRRVLKALGEGNMVALFPEGTRSKDGALQPAKPGIGFLVVRAGVPVVPVYIQGSYEALPRNAKFIRPRRITVTYGPPMDPEVFAALGRGRDAYEKAGNLVMERIRDLSL